MAHHGHCVRRADSDDTSDWQCKYDEFIARERVKLKKADHVTGPKVGANEATACRWCDLEGAALARVDGDGVECAEPAAGQYRDGPSTSAE